MVSRNTRTQTLCPHSPAAALRPFAAAAPCLRRRPRTSKPPPSIARSTSGDAATPLRTSRRSRPGSDADPLQEPHAIADPSPEKSGLLRWAIERGSKGVTFTCGRKRPLHRRREPSLCIGCVQPRSRPWPRAKASAAVGTAERANARVPEGGRCVRCNGESERYYS